MDNTTVEDPSLEEQVAALAQMSPLQFEQVVKDRAAKMGVTVSTLKSEVKKARGVDTSEDSQADIAIELFNSSGAKLFHDDEDVAFAEVPVDNHMEVWAVESKQFRKWLNQRFWNEQNKALREQPRKDAIGTLAGLAEVEGDEFKVYLRSAHHQGRHYIDMCDDDWRVIELDEGGWRIVDRAPIKFRRSSTMAAFPPPVEGGDFQKFWNYANVSEADRPFITAWMVEAHRASTQYPLLELIGGQGTGKSSVHELIRMLVDPNAVNLRGAPSTDKDIWVAARNNHCLSFENVSNMNAGMQDILCTVATGGGHAGRQFYTEYDEAVTKARNPTIINGINPVVTASDLSDRTIRIHIPKIGEKDRREETEIREGFLRNYPEIFGGLLDIFSYALRNIDGITLDTKPRMMSYSIMGEAIGEVLGWKSFNHSYMAMRESLLIEATQSSPAIMAVMEYVMVNGSYHGSYKGLLTKLEDGHYSSRGSSWPSSPKGLSGLLTRHEPGMSAMGFVIRREGHSRTGNVIQITRLKPKKDPDPETEARAEDKLSENNVHNVHNVHKQPSREHCEHGELVSDTKNPPSAPVFEEEI